MGRGTALIIAPAWPSHDNGYGLAVLSNLLHHISFHDKVVFVGVTSDVPPGHLLYTTLPVEFRHVPIGTSAPWLRFARSVFSPVPAVAIRFVSGQIWRQVQQIGESVSAQGQLTRVVIEDVPLGFGVGRLAAVIPSDVNIVLRSHNVLSQAFEEFGTRGPLLRQLAWRMEVRKIAKFEKRVLDDVDEVIAISDSDAAEYANRYAVECRAIQRVRIDTTRYRGVKRGALHTIVAVGSADIRKAHGLRSFIDVVWPRIKSRFSSARLVLGGRGTEEFHDPAMSIDGRGYVTNEIEVMSEGVVFLNTQMVGSGVQLKSLVAMASGKLLVSTPKGVAGVDGIAGRHYLVYRSSAEAEGILTRVMSGTLDCEPIIENASSLVHDRYSIRDLAVASQILA